MASAVAGGTLVLEKPFLARGRELGEIGYNFAKLDGWEYLEAMDADPANKDMFRISQKQAFGLFAKAAKKETPDIDEIDLRQRMGVGDIMNAVRVGTAFFIVTSRAANRRIKDV
ncbi:hypothetical protein FACS1894196_4590 [Clostridia bacterium]|nr:hypothetical protein FACS1894196_4590 [Clostridia bacterium]